MTAFSKADVQNVRIGIEPNVCLWPKADIRTESKSVFVNDHFGEKGAGTRARIIKVAVSLDCPISRPALLQAGCSLRDPGVAQFQKYRAILLSEIENIVVFELIVGVAEEENRLRVQLVGIEELRTQVQRVGVRIRIVE